MNSGNRSKWTLTAALTALFLFMALGQTALAADVGGVKLDDTSQLAGKELKLNGAGFRIKGIFFKLYVAGLYLPQKASTPAEVLAIDGPRRMVLVMQREISSEDFGNAFMKGLNANSDKKEKSAIINQTMAWGEMFASMQGLKKGDVLYLDWIPGAGTQATLNGKKVGDTLPGVAFYNAVLRIWLGDNAVDDALKPALLGTKG